MRIQRRRFRRHAFKKQAIQAHAAGSALPNAYAVSYAGHQVAAEDLWAAFGAARIHRLLVSARLGLLSGPGPRHATSHEPMNINCNSILARNPATVLRNPRHNNTVEPARDTQGDLGPWRQARLLLLLPT